MDSNLSLQTTDIENRIHIIRNQQVMIDRDLAELYGVETKVVNQAVKRNIDRFPEHLMFQLSRMEQLELENFTNLKSQFVTSSWGGRRKTSYSNRFPQTFAFY